jgi:hypothetical protein
MINDENPPRSRRPERSQLYPWYDSYWLTAFARAKAMLRRLRPEAAGELERAMRVFHTRLDFSPRHLKEVFDAPTMAAIHSVVAALRPAQLELHESRLFGRFVVHDHPEFTRLQHTLTQMVSEAVGEPVEPSYNFLSLYGQMGVCPVHLDSPKAKYTVDLCLAQSEPWPIHFSRVIEWPATDGRPWQQEESRDQWREQIKRSPELRFTGYTLQPGEALLFSGSSQWHYREALPRGAGRQFCDLLFFHFIPRGTAELVEPKNWARLFSAPELAEVLDEAD